MKHFLISFLIAGVLIPLAPAWVFEKKIEKSEKGCNFDGKDFEVYDAIQDPETCGIYVCQSTEGDALIYYCQLPVPVEKCDGSGVSTVTDFPQCCWMCVKYVSCG